MLLEQICAYAIKLRFAAADLTNECTYEYVVPRSMPIATMVADGFRDVCVLVYECRKQSLLVLCAVGDSTSVHSEAVQAGALACFI
jgi:hypothetical protein